MISESVGVVVYYIILDCYRRYLTFTRTYLYSWKRKKVLCLRYVKSSHLFCLSLN